MGLEAAGPRADALRRGFEEGRDAYGPLALPLEDYAAAVEERLLRRLRRAGIEAGAAESAGLLPRTALADLFLSVACDAGVPGAWEAFEAAYRCRLVALAIEEGARREEAEALVDDLPGHLLAPPASNGSRTRIGTYDGAASLFSWLASILLHAIADLHRGRRGISLEELLRAEEEGRRPALSAPAADPILVAAGAETARRFDEALRTAWGRLTPREGLVLLWKFRDGLPQREIARILGVGPPRITRLLQAGLAKVRDAVEERMPAAGGDGWAPLWRVLAQTAGEHLEREAIRAAGAVPPKGGR